jgi:hypothetical protein
MAERLSKRFMLVVTNQYSLKIPFLSVDSDNADIKGRILTPQLHPLAHSPE